MISSNNSPAGPDGRKNSPSGVVNHSCSRSKPSPPGLPSPSFGPAMYASSDIDMYSTDADTSTSCGLDPNRFRRVGDPAWRHFSSVEPQLDHLLDTPWADA